jgi:hypothetical protein
MGFSIGVLFSKILIGDIDAIINRRDYIINNFLFGVIFIKTFYISIRS